MLIITITITISVKNSQLRLIQQINTGGKVGTSHVIGKIVVHCHEVCHNFPTNIFSG